MMEDMRDEGILGDFEAPGRDDVSAAADEVVDAVDAYTVDGDRSTQDHESGRPMRRHLVLGDEDPRDAQLAEKVVSEDVAWTGKIFNVDRLRVELPNGQQAIRDVVRHPGAVAIVALTDDGRICLVRQYRTSLGRVTVEIPDGASGRDVLNILLENGVITNGNDFNKAVQAQGAESSMKSGLYDFVTGSQASDVVKQLVAGPNSTKGQVTVAEGLTVQKTAETLSDQLGISQEDFLAQAKASNYASDYTFLSAAQDDSLEGFLFGKTYKLTKESPTADDAIRAMLDQYQSEVASLDFATAEATIKDQYGVTMTDYDVLTLASIIEKEALNDDDRVKIASVFYNRLKAGMALQSDATMGYVTGGEVTADDLQTDSPYNTYLYKGLPPTPICSPSLASVQAALAPAETNYLYFWITDSEHVFSETYDEHLNAVNGASTSD